MKPSEALKPELKEVEVQVDNNELETLRGNLQAFPGKGGIRFGGQIRLNRGEVMFLRGFFNVFLFMGVDVCRKDGSGFG